MVLNQEGAWVVDPDWEEETNATASFGVGWGFGAGLGVKSSKDGGEGERKGEEVVWFEAEGVFAEEEVSSVRRPTRLSFSPFDALWIYLRERAELFFFFLFFLSATFLSDQISKALELSLVAARQTLALIRSKVELAFLESSAASSVDVEVEGEGEAMEI